jgi:hypothetical protein
MTEQEYAELIAIVRMAAETNKLWLSPMRGGLDTNRRWRR